MIAAISVSTWVQAGEELGWRAFALPRMAKGLGLGPASVLLGVIWASWHFPLFLMPATTTTGQSFPLYLLQVTAISVTMAWLYWRTNCSLLLVMVLHAAVNNTKDIVPSAVPGATNVFALSNSRIAWLTVALLWIAAAYFLFAMRGAMSSGSCACPPGSSPGNARIGALGENHGEPADAGHLRMHEGRWK
jgi:membrane protease YdiL (CAAX protease family)